MAVDKSISTPILIVGAGPIGMVLALQLAANRVNCMLIERNSDTTTYPKMEYANMRSLELLTMLDKGLGSDLVERLRSIGVPGQTPTTTIYSTGLSAENGKVITLDDIPAPLEYLNESRSINNGNHHSQAPLRCSQILLEAELKRQILKQSDKISAHWNTKFESLDETPRGVVSMATNLETGEQLEITSQFVVGCDGAGSRVRKFTGRTQKDPMESDVPAEEAPPPMELHLIHFRSHDFEVLHRHGRFWHILLTNGTIIVAQDERETWTVHTPIPVDADITSPEHDPKETLHRVLGGDGKRLDIKIDEILVQGKWSPSGNAIVENYRSVDGRTFLAGDAAHRRIPAGGYGFNTGIGDAIDLGWKLGYVLTHQGQQEIQSSLASTSSSLNKFLDSYSTERRGVSLRNIKRASEHWSKQLEWWSWILGSPDGPQVVYSDSIEGQKLRTRIHQHIQANDAIHRDHGTETDYRYTDSPIVIKNEDEGAEPSFNSRHVTAGTYPGMRVPCVWLNNEDQPVSTHSYLASSGQLTLFDFSDDVTYGKTLEAASEQADVKVKVVHLRTDVPEHANARKILERDAVLVRPDGHVAWRCKRNGEIGGDGNMRSVVDRLLGRG